MENARILLVDDEPNLLAALRRHLGRQYSVTTAASGREALEVLAKEAAFEVAVVDMRMPEMTGIELFEKMKSCAPDTLRIMLTGNADQATAVQAVNDGQVFRFLNKPATTDVVSEAIEAGVNKYRLVAAERALVRQAEVVQQALEAERQANRAQRDFVAMVSHEFRTPLMIIDSAIELLGGAYQLDESQTSKRLQQIREQVRRLNELMESTLNISRLEAGKVSFTPRPLDLPALLRKIGDRYASLSKSHTVQYDFRKLHKPVEGDDKLLEHIFGNLVSNAIKYSPKSDTIFIGAHDIDDGIEVEFVDFGVGIPPAEIPKLFDRFFRASTATGIPGSGIGLHLVQRFVQLHGGRVDICSNVGKGTRVKVALPMPPPATA